MLPLPKKMPKTANRLRHRLNLWSPLFFAGIKITYLSYDYTHFRATLKNWPAHIDFIKAARGEVYLDCQISRKEIDEILSATASGEKHFPQFTVRVFDENNETIAIATRTLYVRLKKEFRPQ